MPSWEYLEVAVDLSRKTWKDSNGRSEKLRKGNTAPLLSELVLSPLMAAARAANDMGRFGMLHGLAAVLFVAAAFGALALVLRFNRPAG